MSTPDRLDQLAKQNHVTGIDFVYVYEGQLKLDVHFFKPRPGELVQPLSADLTKEKLRIYSPDGNPSPVPVESMTWISGNNVMQLTTAQPGDFTIYRLYIDNERIDPYFNNIPFSFKANCENDFDCQPAGHQCPPEEEIDFPVDYRARDFWSFRRALLDFSSQRYPGWQDRLEADAGVMLAEVMSALGDEFAYYQDRVAREAYLETATQRRSLRNLAKLVDYDIHDGLGASTWLDIAVESGEGNIPAGTGVWAVSKNPGAAQPQKSSASIVYEIGRGLHDKIDGQSFNVKAARSKLFPHIWDEDDTCLGVGATELYIEGHHKAHIIPGPPDEDLPYRWVLLTTTPDRPDLPVRNWLVRLALVEDEDANGDPLKDPVLDKEITRIAWDESQALPFEMDKTVMEIHGNLVPATAGEEIECFFTIAADPGDLGLPPEAEKEVVRAVEREGRDGCVTYLFSLSTTETEELVRLGDDPGTASPEIRLVEVEHDGAQWNEIPGPWMWRRSFTGVHSSHPGDKHFTLEDGIWRRVAGYQRTGRETVHIDYASGIGSTIRFGDGQFGLSPAQGTIFKVTYRVGNGTAANLPPHSLTQFAPINGISIQSISNPLPSENGIEAEDAAAIKKLAPDAFRAVTYRAVRPEDYAEAAERLDWVQKAGASFRWTGSWISAFVTPDPKEAVTVSPDRHRDLARQMDRFRQAGREVIVKKPRYADINLEITVCVEPFAYRGEVKEAVMNALLDSTISPGRTPAPAFFSPDNFTFGDPLERSVLEAAIQAVPGVRTVTYMTIRRRDRHDWRELTELSYTVAPNEIIRLENDPLHPERGSLNLKMEGGA